VLSDAAFRPARVVSCAAPEIRSLVLAAEARTVLRLAFVLPARRLVDALFLLVLLVMASSFQKYQKSK
jgi:hypothetical protein